MKKDELRKIYLSKRKALSSDELNQLSEQLCDLFFLSVDLSKIKVLHIYLPIESKQEPDTWLLMDRLNNEYPAIQLSIPKVDNDKMESFFYEGNQQLEKNHWGILEPAYGVSTPPEKIDLIVVPLLAFDLHGHRVGYGRGFYDRFLKTCRPDCLKIGLSLFEPVDAIDFNQHDVLLNQCLTPAQLYSF